ncbi:MAG: hypothetical protein Pg6C_16940 [Treponemataceae bacterium]|nr:MAG: hypothetical protein Pg6C_16940 [Treponemataceae bacterium]
MNKDNITDTDNWYYDGPEDGSSLRGGPLASKYMQKVFEDIAFRAFGQEGVDRYRANQRVMDRSGK